MSGLIGEPLGNTALTGGPGRNAPGDAYPASIWDSQDWFGLTQQLARGIGNTAASYGTFDDFGRPLSAPEPSISAADANTRFGIDGHLHFANDLPESVASAKYDAKRAELMREAQSSASGAGVLARFGAGLVSGALDPLNDLAGIVPGIGEARIGGLLAKAGLESGLGATMATRALSGASAGMAAQVPLVGLRYGLSQQEQADYSASDAMADIIMGGALGGGLHTAIGGLGDIIGGRFARSRIAALAEDSPQVREQLLRAATAQQVNGETVQLAPVLDTDQVRTSFRDRLTARGETAAGSYAAYTPQGLRVELQPEVIEAEELIASNDGSGAVNPDYPQDLQPRDRSSAASMAQVTELASRLEPERLGPSPEVSTGAPIVNAGNVVESGNGRIMALRRVYEDPALADQAAAYRAYLEARGHDISGMKAPVLIGRRVTEMNPEQARGFTKAANERATLGMNAAEQARADATRAGKAIADFAPAPLHSSANRDFVAGFMAQVPAEERGGMVLANGQLSAAGETRIRAALLAHAFGDSLGPTLERMLNGDVEHMKAVAGALADSAGMFSKLRVAAQTGEIPAGLDITPAIGEAVQLLDRARSTGTPLATLLAQADMIGGASPAARGLLRLMFRDEAMRQPIARAKLAELLDHYVVQALEAKAGPGLFGEAETTPADIMRAIGRDDMRSQAAATGLETAPSEVNPDRPGDTSESRTRSPIIGFKTAKGSTYEVHDDDTTTRDKAYRPEHGEAEQGPQTRSERTIYVTAADAVKLGEFQAISEVGKAIAPVSDGGQWGMKYLDGPNAGRFERRTVVTPKGEPAPGLIPVEVWRDGKRVHFGNAITEVTRGEATAARTHADEAAAAEPNQGTGHADNEGGYVASSTGSTDLGRIDETMAAAIGSEPGPIRLTERAEAHIEQRRSELLPHGYSSAADFVEKIAAGFNEIWTAGGDSLMLVKRVQGETKERAHSLYVLLNAASDGNAYEVKSGGVFRASYPAGMDRKLLWQEGRATLPTGTDNQTSRRRPQTTRSEPETTHSAESQSTADLGGSGTERNDPATTAPDATPDLFGEQPATKEETRSAASVPAELAQQIDALQRDFADLAAGDQMNPEAEAELARIAQDHEAAQGVLGAIDQAAQCLLGGLSL